MRSTREESSSGAVSTPVRGNRVQFTVTLLPDLQGFVCDHRPHSPLTGDATEGLRKPIGRETTWRASHGDQRDLMRADPIIE